jgi:hypothetical protein
MPGIIVGELLLFLLLQIRSLHTIVSYDGHVLTLCFLLRMLLPCRGIAWAPACGVAISELVLEGECTSVDLAPFDPARFTPTGKRGGRGRKRQGTNVGEQW